MNILLPLSLAQPAKNTMAYAIELAKTINAKLYVIHIYKPYKHAGAKNVDRFIKNVNIQEMDVIISAHANSGIEIIAKPVKGNVISSIKRIAKQLNIDLVIMGAKTSSVREDVFLGKVTGKFTKKTKNPVLIIPEGAKFTGIRKALFAIKGGELKTKGRLKQALAFLQTFDAYYNVVQVKTMVVKDVGEIDVKLSAGAKEIFHEEHAQIQDALTQHNDYDVVLVVRRKQGFFSRIWKNDKVLKSDFDSTTPIYVIPSK